MAIERFEEIRGWQLGRDLCRTVYAYTRCGDFAKDWGLKDQITRAAGSVMNNIAEGYDSGSNNEFIRFLGYAKRSSTEVQSQLYIALDQGYIDRVQFAAAYTLAGDARAAIVGFITYLENCDRQQN